MHLSDEAKLFAVRAKLLEAERKIYEANKIMAYINVCSCPETEQNSVNYKTENGLYPGQLPEQKDFCEIGETSECVE